MSPSLWTMPMLQALVALQQRPVLRQILAYAEQRRVQLYVVGGALRDLCLGRSPHDVDLVLAGDVIAFARAVAKQIGAAYVPLDPARGEVRLVYRKRDGFDFARLKGHSIGEDLAHRDFTINAMACPLAALLEQDTPDLIDPYGGHQDLHERRVRMVTPQSFQDDPLRLLRAFRFAAALEYTIDAATLASMEAVIPRLGEIAAERIHHELFALFSAPRSSPQIVTMARLGLLEVLFPELAAIQAPSLPAKEPSGLFKHAIHTYEAVEDVLNNLSANFPMIAAEMVAHLRRDERPALIKCAALMHVIGHPPPCHPALCRAPSPGRPTPPTPALEAAQQWERIGSRLRLSRQRIDAVKTVLVHRHHPFIMADLAAHGRLTLRTVYDWGKEVGEAMLDVFALAVGDAKAWHQLDTPVCGAMALARCAGEVWGLYQRQILPVLKSPRLLTGDDLQRLFHLDPGPHFRELLDALQVAQVEGHIHTRAEALAWVAQRLQHS